MRIRSFNAIAICALALGLTGCRVQSVLVMPSLTPLSYAASGQTLEWLPSNPDPKAPPIYIVFDGASPCAEQFYQIGPGPKPARCKVLKGHNGYFRYHFDTDSPKPPTDTTLYARSCPYCQLAIDPGNSATSSRVVKKTANAAGYTLPVTCSGTPAVAVVDNSTIPNGVQVGDSISWIPLYPNTGLKVTTTDMCLVNGVFTPADACTVNGTPGTHQYSVHLKECGDGTGNLTINPSPQPPSPQP